jgi:aminocarboxymuconate-semialdehyde decarboxylase
MTTRRDFIGGMTGAMAGVAFVGCELMHTTHAHAQPAPRRREVVVNGRRVKTVDVHAHCAFPDAMALMGLKVNPEALVMGTERIKAMDEQGIDVEALSINAYWYKADRDLARQLTSCRTRSWPSCARRSPTASSPLPR